MTEILGTDIKLDAYGEIQLTPSGDIDSVSSLSNMYQALRNRFSLERGDLVYDKSYGLVFDKIMGSKNTATNISQFKLDLIKELRKDARITSIIDIQITPVEDNPKAYDIVIVLKAAETDQEVAISFVYPYYSPEITARNIIDERQLTIDKESVQTEYTIHTVKEIYLATDANKTGTDYFLGGYVLSDNNTIILGTPVLSPKTPVFITYTTLETERLGYSTAEITETINLDDTTSGETIDLYTLTVANEIYDVIGVWNEDDTLEEGTNYYYGGTYSGTSIVLGTKIPTPRSVIVNYIKKE